MADTDDWATERASAAFAKLTLYLFRDDRERLLAAIASALRDARREGLEEAAAAYDRFGENAEHNYHVQIDAGDLDAAGRWADIRDSHDNVARHLRALAAGGKGE